MLDKAIAPKIGRTPFPAFLKNCLLFRSSSSFLFFPLSFMTLSFIAIRIPDFANLKLLYMKRRGNLHSLIPHSGSRIASSQDKQRKKPTPRDIICVRHERRRYNTPNADVPLPYLL